MKTLLPAIALSALVMGCSDSNLRPVEPVDYGDAPTIPVAGNSIEGPGDVWDGLPGNGNGNSGDGPWSGLDAGNLPEEYFAVAWRPSPCDDCWDNDYGVENGHRFDIVDLEGRVIVSLERPFVDPGVLFERFEPGPDGTLLVVETGRHDTNYYVPSEWQKRVWRANVVTEETEELLRISWGHVELASGRSFPLDSHEVRFAVDPENADIVWIASPGQWWMERMLLIRVDVFDPDAEPTFHELPVMNLFGSVDGDWATFPTNLEVARTGRDLELVLTFAGGPIFSMETDLPTGVVVYRPEDGSVQKAMNLRARGFLADVQFGNTGTDTGHIGSSALLQVGHPRAMCSSPRFAQVDPATLIDAGESPLLDPTADGSVTAIEGDQSMLCSRMGPLLDDAGPTFVYWGERTDSGHAAHDCSSIVVSHAGQDVWTWDTLRVGLNNSEFQLLGLERVIVP
jgi:hypothetical protein